jgi:prevent-host-death family protein
MLATDLAASADPSERSVMDLNEDIRSIDELRKDPTQVLSTLHRTRRPVIITVDGEPDAIILSAKLFENKMTAMKAAVDLATATG